MKMETLKRLVGKSLRYAGSQLANNYKDVSRRSSDPVHPQVCINNIPFSFQSVLGWALKSVALI